MTSQVPIDPVGAERREMSSSSAQNSLVQAGNLVHEKIESHTYLVHPIDPFGGQLRAVELTCSLDDYLRSH